VAILKAQLTPKEVAAIRKYLEVTHRAVEVIHKVAEAILKVAEAIPKVVAYILKAQLLTQCIPQATFLLVQQGDSSILTHKVYYTIGL